jgi:hypothetical protein
MIKIENMLVPLSHYRKWLIPFQDEKTREFIQKAKLIHGDKYDYKFVKYINSKIKVCLMCHRHGEFWITPDSLCNAKSGCKICGLNRQEVDNLDDFIKRSIEVHGDRYDYSESIFTGFHNKIKIGCPIHGTFLKSPYFHIIQKQGCPDCARLKTSIDDFLNNSKRIHGDTYDYSKVIYLGSHRKVEIVCPIHGSFWMRPHDHITGEQGCPECGKIKYSKKRAKPLDTFIKEANEVHENKYDYSKAIYVNNRTKIEIICPIQGHGSFWQLPDNHLKGCGCPMCLNKCESYVGEWLKDNNFEFKYHQKVDIIKIKDNIEIDYIISYNGIDYWIEYNGIQHYMYVEHFHRDGIENFKDQLRRDEKVKNYCNRNNISLLEIPYIYNTKNSIYLFLDKVLINKINPNLLVNYESLYRRPSDYISILGN